MSDRDVIRHEYIFEYDPQHPDADPVTGLREWTREELQAANERPAAQQDSSLRSALQ